MTDMHVMHTLRADLNLVPALAVLVEERHVSRAAARLGLSQPAMSRALARLRTLFDDPLLIRRPDGYLLTARGEALREQLEALVPQLEALVSPVVFDPRHAGRPFDLAGTDFAVHAYGSAICRHVMAAAPEAVVRFHGWRYDTVATQISRGNIDLGFYGGYASADLSSAELVTEEFVCVMAADHPSAGVPEFALTEYLQLRHIVVDVADGLQPDVDFKLRSLEVDRDAAITVPYHASVPELLAGTALVATIPGSLARRWKGTYPIAIAAAPGEISTMSYRMVWHPAFDDDARHRWLRDIVRSAITGWANH